MHNDQLVYQVIATKSGQTGFIKLGNGPALVMLVGYSGTLFHWNSDFINELSKFFTLYLIDNRNIGQSHSTNATTMEGFALDVFDFIQAMNLQKPIVLGWSMGGVIVQELALKYEELLSGVIFLATVPDMRKVNKDFTNLVANSEAYSPSEFKKQLYYFFFSDNNNQDMKDKIKDNSLKMLNYHYRFTSEAKMTQAQAIASWPGVTQTELSKLQLPILILYAKNDLVVSFEAIKYLFDHSNNSKLVIYSQGGHFLIHTDANKIAKDITNFYGY